MPSVRMLFDGVEKRTVASCLAPLCSRLGGSLEPIFFLVIVKIGQDAHDACYSMKFKEDNC